MTDLNKISREVGGLALLFFCAFVGLSLATYSPQDPTFNQQVSPTLELQNAAGVVGAYLSGILVQGFGLVAWYIVPILIVSGGSLLHTRLRPYIHRWVGLFLLFLCLLGLMSSPWGRGIEAAGIQGGGLLGSVLYSWATAYLHFAGALLLWLFLLLLGIQLTFGHTWSGAAERITSFPLFLWETMKRMFRYPFALLRRNPVKAYVNKKTAEGEAEGRVALPEARSAGKEAGPAKSNKGGRKDTGRTKAGRTIKQAGGYPDPDLLTPVPEKGSPTHAEEVEELSQRLMSCLSDFGIKGELMEVQSGPVVTMFEFKPAPGIKINRIANLSNDLALALKAYAVRIVAPIPGKDMVGIEVPNRRRQTVYFREIIESKQFSRTKGALPLALGQTIEGSPRVEDLAELPHLLVAGATGTGKSVCLNGIILSLIFKASPEEVKLLLIDPKRIELAEYGDLPHLVHPVVTEMDLAKAALNWALQEMETRYEAMSALGVRNIQSYNRKLRELRRKDPEAVQDRQYMPFLVIIIDELADLMMTAGKEAEGSIVRLAQLARAAGIHIILATQRPSVDVVTGLIKANFPARIAFQVSSKHDSRTILDTGGAEYLLGKGDLLFKSTAGRLERLHGPFLSDAEISAVIDFWKGKCPVAESEVDLQQWREEGKNGSRNGEANDLSQDPLYEQAIKFVQEEGKASISMIQRQLRIGFNRAARYVEQMEQDGIVGPQEGSKPRMVKRG